MRINYTDAQWYCSTDSRFYPGTLSVTDGVITALTPKGELPPAAERTESLKGRLVIPGLVDVHTHGCMGSDFSSADGAGMRAMARAYAARGVTALMPTLASAPLSRMKTAVELIAGLREAGTGGARFLGVHLEGRYLNPAKRGAHAAELLTPLDPDELEELLFRACPPPAHVTAAYELDPTGQFLARVLSLGGTAGLAHTCADYDETMAAIEGGLTSVSHLFNTMHPLHHREPGPVCAALTTDVYTEVICDGRHVHPGMVRLAYAAKKRGRFVLVTDSMEATGMGDGEYRIAGMPVTVKDGEARTHDGALAGSLLHLMDGVHNLVRFAGITFGEAVLCATRAPADMVGCSTVGDLLPGRMADFLVLDTDDPCALTPGIAGVYLGGLPLHEA